MNGGHSLSQAPSPAPSVSLSCGWNKLQLITLAVPMAAVVDESPFTVKLSDARQAHASREGRPSAIRQPGHQYRRKKVLVVVPSSRKVVGEGP